MPKQTRTREWIVLWAALATVAASSNLWAQATMPARVSPQQEAQARSHFQRGLTLFNAQDFGGALAEFQAAYDMSHRATVLYNIGVSQQSLHHYPEAARAIEQYLRDATITPARRAQVEQGLNEIHGFIAQVTISGLPNGAVISIDGDRAGVAPLPGPVTIGSGQHTITAHLDGYQDAQESLLIAGGQARDVPIALHPIVVTPSAPVETAVPASIEVQGTPANAVVQIDGNAARAGRAVSVAPGSHVVRVETDGYAPWEGRVQVASGRRSVNVHMARQRGISPVPMALAAGLTVLFGIGTAIAGALTLDTHSKFIMLTQEDSMAQALSQQGTTERLATNILIGCTGAAAITAIILATQTAFHTPVSTVDIALAPRLDGGLDAALRVRF